jgi:hypothetical protein
MRATLVAAALTALSVLTTTTAVAEPTVSATLERLERGDPAGKYFLMGLGAGLSWANATLNSEHKQLIFCVPEKVALTSEQELDILKRYVQANPEFGNLSVGAVLVAALIDAFPCH